MQTAGTADNMLCTVHEKHYVSLHAIDVLVIVASAPLLPGGYPTVAKVPGAIVLL